MQKKGYVSFVLHAHLPFIHHPESDDYLEESWLYEAISECYIPLITNFQKLVDEKGNKSLDMNVELNVPDSEEKTIICMASNVNGIQFQQPGMYIFILSVDGKEYGECKLKLIQKE